MLDHFMTVQCAAHIMVGPPPAKFGADLLQILDQFIEPGITRITSAGCTKLCQRCPRNSFPVRTLSRSRISEEPPDHISGIWRRCIRNDIGYGEKSIGCFVPCEIIIASPQY